MLVRNSAHTLFTALGPLVGLVGCATDVREVGLEAAFEAGGPGVATVDVGASTADPQTFRPLGPTLSLVFLPDGTDALPVREAPSVDGEVIDTLDRYTLDVPSTGRRQTVHGITWVEVVTEAGLGFIGAQHTTEFVPSEDFCEAPEVTEHMLHEIANTLYQGNADGFASLISPIHGLRVRYVRTDAPSHFTAEWAASAISDDQSLEWGVDPATGEMVRGSFDERVGQELSTAIARGEVSCNRLTTGAAPHVPGVPDSEVNLNFVSIHLPANDEVGMDWVTWTVGLAFEGDRAMLVTLNRYAWEG